MSEKQKIDYTIDCTSCDDGILEEEFGVVTDAEHDESCDVLVGYKCNKCGVRYDTNMEEVE